MHNSLYNYEKFPKNSRFPLLEKDTLDTLKYSDLATAIEKFVEQRTKYLAYFKEQPEAILNIWFLES